MTVTAKQKQFGKGASSVVAGGRATVDVAAQLTQLGLDLKRIEKN